MRINRRDFIRATAVTGAGFLVSTGHSHKQARASSLQSVAVGGIGAFDIMQAGKCGKVVAICDVNRNTLESKLEEFPDAKKYVDYRDLFAEMGDKIDAVTVSVPDHMHSIIAATAIKQGKHVFTQAPLTRTVYEARLLGKLAQKYGVCTQTHVQNTTPSEIAAQIRAGVVGEVTEVHIWSDRPIWAQGPGRAMTMKKFTATVKKEEKDKKAADNLVKEMKKRIADELKNIAWDQWLGVAPRREFWLGVYCPFQWRGWWDFGAGALGSSGHEYVNMIFDAVDLRNPTSVVAKSTGHDFDSFPKTSTCAFEIPANDWRGPIKFVWYDSSLIPPAKLTAKYGFNEVDKSGGCFVIGSEGAALISDSQALYHDENGKDISKLPGVQPEHVAPDNRELAQVAGQKYEWFTAIQENKPEICRFNFPDYAGPLAETILLGNLAIWTAPKKGLGEKIKWDSKNLKVTNLDDLKTPGVAGLVKPVYQNGYDPIDELGEL